MPSEVIRASWVMAIEIVPVLSSPQMWFPPVMSGPYKMFLPVMPAEVFPASWVMAIDGVPASHVMAI